MSDEKLKTIEIPYKKPRNFVLRLYRTLKSGDLAVDGPDESRISAFIQAAENEAFALQRRSEDSLNRKTILRFVPLETVLEDRLQNVEISFRRKITPRTILVWFYSVLFMFLPWDIDDFEMVPDEKKIADYVQHRAERGYELERREDDHLNLKTNLKFTKR